jgi:hypothetical protein
MADTIFNSAKTDLFSGTTNFAATSPVQVSMMLLTSSYTIDASDVTVSDLGAVEVSGTGYTTGGKVLTNPTVALSSTTAVFDADNVSWTSATITARYAVLYNNTNNRLICLYDFGTNQSSTNGTFTVQFNALGALRIA